jgi:membrane protein DedA with SNARE-associated domain
MAFSDTDDVHIVSLSGLDIVFAVLGGLLWLALVIIGARSFGAMFSISLNQPLSIVQAVMILSAILGSVPSLVYNLRVWNKKGIAM